MTIHYKVVETSNVCDEELEKIEIQIDETKLEELELSDVVRAKIKETYINSFQVYTNLVTAQPVLVYVTGAVNHPGRYAGLPSDSVLFFLDLAGGVGRTHRIDVADRHHAGVDARLDDQQALLR